jgi:hypothetical protein
MTPTGCEEYVLAQPDDDIDQVLAALVERLDAAGTEPDTHELSLPEPPSGAPLSLSCCD